MWLSITLGLNNAYQWVMQPYWIDLLYSMTIRKFSLNNLWACIKLLFVLHLSKSEHSIKMKIKVQPNGKSIEKHSSASKFTKFLRFLSNIYILPIEYKNDFKDVKFSLISLRTFISLFLLSTPVLFAMIWWFVFQWSFTSQYLEKSLYVYHLFDFVQMCYVNLFVLIPFPTFGTILWICYLWVYFPTLSQVGRETIFIFIQETFLAPTGRSSGYHKVCLSQSWLCRHVEHSFNLIEGS